MPIGFAMRAEDITMYGIPAIVGVILLGTYLLSRPSLKALVLLAALLTLKPIATTPILSAVANPTPIYDGPLSPETPYPIGQVVLGLLPDIGLTVLIVVMFRSLLSSPGITAPRFLLALDCVRWLDLLLAAAILFTVSSMDSIPLFMLVWPVSVSMILVGALLPNILAVTALAVVVGSALGRGKRISEPEG